MSDSYLVHHGIMGMHWGIRRYQNPDGTLTEAGRKKYSKEYRKLITKASSQVNTTENYAKAYNKAASRLNNGLLDKYNDDYDKKLGEAASDHDYENDEEYNNGYAKLFEDVFNVEYAKIVEQESKNNEYYKKAEELCNKYSLVSFDELAKSNAEGHANALKIIEEDKHK